MSEYYTAAAYASTEALIEPENYIDTQVQFLLRAIRNNESIADSILAVRFAGINAASENYYKCGTDPNCYGINPPSILFTSLADPEDILSWIKGQIGKTNVVFDRYLVGPLNLQFYAESWLFSNYQDELGIPWHPYLDKIAIPDPKEELPYVLVDNNPYHDFNESGLSAVYIDYGVDENGRIIQNKLADLPYLVPYGSYYMFTLKESSEKPPRTEETYVYYKILSEAEAINIPELHITTTTKTYMPITVIMRDEKYYNAYSGLERPTEKILKKLSLKATDIAQACQDVETNNPDLKKTDFFISYGLPANLSSGCIINEVDVENAHWQYLWTFFKFWSEHGAQNKANWTGYIDSQSSLTIQCWDTYTFVMDLSVAYIEPLTSLTEPTLTPNVLWKKLEDGSYEGYEVQDLKAYYHINVSRGYRVGIQDPPLVPIDWKSLEDFKSNAKERILQMSLRATMFLAEEHIEDVPWYKDTFFSVIFTVIAIVITIITYQYELIPILATVLGISVYTATIMVNIVLGIMLTYATAGLPSEIQLLVAIFTVIYTVGTNVNWNWATLWKSFTVNTFGSVTKLLESISDVYSYIKQYSFRDDYQQLMWDISRENQSIQEKQQELQDAYLALNTPSDINPWDLVETSTIIPAETYNEFLARTSWKNAGAESLAMIHNFYKIALTLPDHLGQGNPLMLVNGFPELA